MVVRSVRVRLGSVGGAGWGVILLYPDKNGSDNGAVQATAGVISAVIRSIWADASLY